MGAAPGEKDEGEGALGDESGAGRLTLSGPSAGEHPEAVEPKMPKASAEQRNVRAITASKPSRSFGKTESFHIKT